VVVDGKVGAKALRAVHAAFYLSPNTLSIGLIGPGTVGRVLLAQIETQIERLRARNLDLRVRGIAGSKRMLLEETAIDLDHWAERLAEAGEPLDLAKFADHVQADYIPHTVIIDCTASADVGGQYAAWLTRGIHIVTPNKKANSGTLPYYRALQEAGRAAGTHYLYEATVGAGLPIIQTLRDLRETGDEITRIEGIFSGTLAYLFNVFDGREAFSSIVQAAKAKGYTEPDPRDDLSGMDVARKLIILAREMGLTLEMADVQVDGLVPKALEHCSVDEFMARLPEFDAAMAARLDDARRKNEVLRYVGRVDADGKATVGLMRLDAKHPFANIALTDNVVRFATRRYCDNPLIVQGPGAGPEVTAAGVFSDLLRLSAYLGAHL
jgi:aspartokinase/homoserine dehydrogenase 1